MLSTTLKKLREARGLTQEELADRAGISQPYLLQLEKGHRQNPSARTLHSLAEALGITVDQFFREPKKGGKQKK